MLDRDEFKNKESLKENELKGVTGGLEYVKQGVEEDRKNSWNTDVKPKNGGIFGG